MTEQHWTIKEAAKALGLSEKTVRRRIRDGTLKAEEIPGKHGLEYRITDLGRTRPLDKSLDTRENTPLDKALDIIKAVQEENERLAGQVGFLQALLQELENKVRLLTGPKPKRSWWQRLLWWKQA